MADRAPHTILATARELLAAAMPMIRRQGVTLIGVASPTSPTAAPSSSPCRSTATAARPDAVLDDVRERVGSDAVTRGVLLGRDQGLSVPLLPD